jgi:hypothetical protein
MTNKNLKKFKKLFLKNYFPPPKLNLRHILTKFQVHKSQNNYINQARINNSKPKPFYACT